MKDCRRCLRALIVAAFVLGVFHARDAAADTLTLSVVTSVILVCVAAAETVGRLRRGRRSGG